MRLEPKPSEVFIMTKYPHLGRYENILFTWFLKNIGWDDILRIDYDIRVGKGYVPDYIKEENIRRMAEAITKLRIDAVIERVDEIWIIEIKEKASLSAVGQLITYSNYYTKEFKPMKPVNVGVICDYFNPSIIDICEQYSIAIFKVSPNRVEKIV